MQEAQVKRFTKGGKTVRVPAIPSYASEAEYVLSTSKGINEYFDIDGKLICQDDRFGNHISYEYDRTGTPFQCSLKKITDSFGQKIGIDCAANAVTVTLPDGRTVGYDFSSTDKVTVKGIDGRIAIIYLTYVKGEKKVCGIKYPTGGEVRYEYTEQAIPFSINGNTDYFSAITKVIEDPGFGGREIRTEYDYNAINGCNFAGNTLCDYNMYGSDRDPLMQSNNNAYRYATTVISSRDVDCGGNIQSTQTFNFLHLPLSGDIRDSSGKVVFAESYTHYLGDSGKKGHEDFSDYDNLQANYNLPAKVSTTVSGVSHSTETEYDDYSRPVKVTKCNREKPISEITTTYGEYDLIVSQKEEDKVDGTEKTLANTLSEDKKYIAKSVASLKGKEKITERVLDPCGREVKARLSEELGSGVSAYSPNSSSIRSKYERRGNFLTVTNENDEGHKTSKTIDIRNGRIIEEKDANGNIIKYSYPENSDLVVEKSYPDGSWEKTDNRDPKKSITSYSNDMVITRMLDGFGRVIKESDNFGRSVSTEYNQLGKPSKETDIFGNWTKYAYDYQGRLKEATDKYGNKIETFYNDADQTATEKINGITSAVSYYDDSGNLKSRIDYLEDQKPTQETEYNGQNLAMKSQLILGKEKLLTLKIDEYDLEGRPLKSSTNTKDGVNGESDVIYSLFGDVIRKKTKFTSAGPGRELGTGEVKGETRKYNKIGKLESLIDQEGKSILYGYDPNGNLISMEDFSKNEIKYEYDNMNRMMKMSGPGYLLENTYYKGEGPSQGQLESRVLKKGGVETDKIEYKYDDYGRLSTISTNGKSMSIGYDKYDRVVSVTDYAGKKTIYEYDKDYPENIKRVAKTIGDTEYSATYSYYTLSDGPLFGDGATVESVIYSNGIRVSYTYDAPEGKAPKLEKIETIGKAGVISCTKYGYDELGRISELAQSSETDPANTNCNNTKCFTYNLLGEIISETVKDKSNNLITRTEYTRDISGNIVKKIIYGKDGQRLISSNIYKYNDINQLLEQKDTVSGTVNTYEYDNGKTGNGNLTCIRKNGAIEKQFAYNVLNQLTSYKDNQGVDVCYEYNAESLRKCKYFKDHPKKKILYYYSPENSEIMNEEDSVSKLMTSYLEAGGKVLRAVGDKAEWHIKNGKDVVATVNNDQSKTNTYNYNAYGEQTDLKDGGAVVSIDGSFDIRDNPYKYSGYYIDEESGMYYLQARYYSPEIMRFISWDTYDVSNRYAYCEGNPISKVDPNGHMSQGAAMGITSAVDVASMVAETALGAIPFVGPILSIIFGVISSAGSEALYQGLTGGIKDPAAIGIAAGIGLALGGGLGVLGKVATKFKWAAKLKNVFTNKGNKKGFEDLTKRELSAEYLKQGTKIDYDSGAVLLNRVKDKDVKPINIEPRNITPKEVYDTIGAKTIKRLEQSDDNYINALFTEDDSKILRAKNKMFSMQTKIGRKVKRSYPELNNTQEPLAK